MTILEDHAERLDATFQEVLDAANDIDNQMLNVHMWEWLPEKRSEEIKTKLDVMSGNEEAILKDEYRHQKGDPKYGMKCMATTAISASAKVKLFETLRNPLATGLLLTNTTPVAVYSEDCNSRYEPESAPDTRLSIFPEKKSRFDEEEHTQRWRFALMEVLSVFQDQAIGKEILISPSDPDRFKTAKEAHTFMMRQFEERDDVLHEHNESVNHAKLEDIAGVTIYFPYDVDQSQPWSTILEQNKGLVHSLLDATQQITLIKEAFEKASIEKEPTIVIYQPEAPNRLMHFPPTKQNLQMLHAVAKQHGFLLADERNACAAR